MQPFVAVRALACVVGLALIACGQTAPQATSSNPLVTAGPLLTVRGEGGLCIYGPCWSETVVNTDGSFRATDGTGAQRRGTLDAAQTAELSRLIAAADFAGLRATPFTGTCPTAFDGQEQIYTFHTAAGPEVIRSCQVAIDEAAPLWSTTTAVLAASQE